MAAVTGAATGVVTEATEAIVRMGVGEEGALALTAAVARRDWNAGAEDGGTNSDGHGFYLILTIVCYRY